MNGKHMLGALAVGAAALVAAGAAASPTPGSDPQPGPRVVAKWAKLASPLVAVLKAERASGRGLAVARANGLRVLRGRVRVVVETQGSRSVARRAIVAAGGEVEAVHANLVQALVAPAALAALTRPAAVVFVRAPRVPFPIG